MSQLVQVCQLTEVLQKKLLRDKNFQVLHTTNQCERKVYLQK